MLVPGKQPVQRSMSNKDLSSETFLSSIEMALIMVNNYEDYKKLPDGDSSGTLLMQLFDPSYTSF
ncbi:hypothetical protein BOTNAR_0198g00040 [Botryotinia narcissicola]|uniref:Uncharacterized protein n=1 Tax=Botryotinia narcissicola TaxID=278944 RepID=A0A4Z1ILM1_9HELO|nr:hypothetical protein BOTNAR_0198g00040 [Botryotinia narcissicola]